MFWPRDFLKDVRPAREPARSARLRPSPILTAFCSRRACAQTQGMRVMADTVCAVCAAGFSATGSQCPGMCTKRPKFQSMKSVYPDKPPLQKQPSS